MARASQLSRSLSAEPDSPLSPDLSLLSEFLALAGCGAAAPQYASHVLREKRTLGATLASGDFELARLGLPAAGRRMIGMLRDAVTLSLRREIEDRPCLTSGPALLNYLHASMAHAPTESLRVLFLDARNRLLRDELMVEGGIDQTPMFVREILKRALEVGATGLILVHNHPSGDPSPSKGDVEATHALAVAAAPLGVEVHEHLIVARCGFSSLRALGLLGRAGHWQEPAVISVAA